jgi:hypothetical protein
MTAPSWSPSGSLWDLLVSIALREIGSVERRTSVERIEHLVTMRERHEAPVRVTRPAERGHDAPTLSVDGETGDIWHEATA